MLVAVPARADDAGLADDGGVPFDGGSALDGADAGAVPSTDVSPTSDEVDPALATGVAGIGVSEADRAVLAQLDAMLDEPTVATPSGNAHTVDELRAAAMGVANRYVVVVAIEARRILLIEPARNRMIQRLLPEALAQASAYTLAGLAYELLELLQSGIAETEPAAPPPQPPQPEGPPEPRLDPPAPSTSGTERREGLVDGFAVGAGARVAVALAGDPTTVDLVVSGEVRLRLPSGQWVFLSASPSRASVTTRSPSRWSECPSASSTIARTSSSDSASDVAAARSSGSRVYGRVLRW